MRILTTTLVTALVFAGCVSAPKIVKTTVEPQRTVTLRYVDGLDNTDSMKQAVEKAQEYCGTGKAKPISEEIRKELDGGMPLVAGQPSMSENIYVTFKCQ